MVSGGLVLFTTAILSSGGESVYPSVVKDLLTACDPTPVARSPALLQSAHFSIATSSQVSGRHPGGDLSVVTSRIARQDQYAKELLSSLTTFKGYCDTMKWSCDADVQILGPKIGAAGIALDDKAKQFQDGQNSLMKDLDFLKAEIAKVPSTQNRYALACASSVARSGAKLKAEFARIQRDAAARAENCASRATCVMIDNSVSVSTSMETTKKPMSEEYDAAGLRK